MKVMRCDLESIGVCIVESKSHEGDALNSVPRDLLICFCCMRPTDRVECVSVILEREHEILIMLFSSLLLNYRILTIMTIYGRYGFHFGSETMRNSSHITNLKNQLIFLNLYRNHYFDCPALLIGSKSLI